MSSDGTDSAYWTSVQATSDNALVVHVWHLDVLDDLVEAAANLPQSTHQYVTVPSDFGSPERDRVVAAFPRAHLVTVENHGQDIGALFQLMKQVDLGQYAFLCKIHTKKGVNPMQAEWRRALLDGVLGSKRQVQHIIDCFRADPQVMLAGARQLYVHGPSYLEPNAERVTATFGEMIGDFDLRRRNWGFIGGTCFWIRTAILLDMAACPLDFQPAAYVSDGAPAHAVERMFGLACAIRGGKVLLQDLRFSERLPDAEQEFPTDLPRKFMRIVQLLTPLAVNLFIKPNRPVSDAAPEARNRVAVFASYSEDGILPSQVIPYLIGLQPVTTAIVVVCDNDLLPAEKERLSGLATHVITGRHGEYVFGSYKRGVAHASKAGLLGQADDLILCNDSCYGPVGSFAPMFAEMETRNLDFWGATDSHEFGYHLQSYFVVLTRNAFMSDTFSSFITGVKKQDKATKVVMNYETGLTKKLTEAGLKSGVFIPNKLFGVHQKDPTYNNLARLPIYTLARGLPLVKVKALNDPRTSVDGPNRVLAWLRTNTPDLYAAAASDVSVAKFEDAENIGFSIIMPTFNRSWCISKAIAAILAQTHQNFELIIVDDGSTDGTEATVNTTFPDEVERGIIRFVKLPENVGVCNARNVGLCFAKHAWIAYADSDNAMRPYFLSVVANAILANSDRDAFFGQIIHLDSGNRAGRIFERELILQSNFIDLGAFVHKRSLVAKYGNFDPRLRRLVDWELIIRFSKDSKPYYIPLVFLDYTDEETADRITVRESFQQADIQIRRKHSPKLTATTIILTYNHEEFIVEAIESALAQKGDFFHEILISDDGSSDGTTRIIDRYAKKYPTKIRNISRGGNHGVSENYRHCFEQSNGQFIAVLEGDDYWTDPEKNFKQAKFLQENKNATMVLSRIELFNMRNNSRRLLKRQDNLPNMLSAADFAANQFLNLMANLSSCMFRSDIMKQLPKLIYEPRINEIVLAFYLDRLGGIGFLSEVMGTYRVNEQSVWSGADRASQLRQSIDARLCALRVARPVYRATIQRHIDERRQLLAKELAKTPKATA